jgi:two-component system NarL family response regulator
MAEGLDNRAIAARLGIGVGTVKWYVVTILSKLDAPDRTNAVLVALRKGLVRLP